MVFKRGPKKLIRNLGNKLGLAWWAKVETQTPSVTYWYGPFLSKRGLNKNLEKFLSDLIDAVSYTHLTLPTKRIV